LRYFQEINFFVEFRDFFAFSLAQSQRPIQEEGHIAAEPGGQFLQL